VIENDPPFREVVKDGNDPGVSGDPGDPGARLLDAA
jgi:hypothetical protein